jgi:glycosyltransferase involved in cell wall biosynthesis
MGTVRERKTSSLVKVIVIFMMNILIDTSPLQNDNAIRGVGLYTRLLTKELKKRDDVKVLESTELEKMRTTKTSEPQTELKPDLIHYPFFDLFFSTLPLKRSCKTVVTVHDVIPLLFPKFYKPGVKGRVRFFHQLASLLTVDAVITDSVTSKKDIIKYLKVKDTKIHVVPLAGNPELHAAPDEVVEKVRKKYKLPQQYIFYIGDINYNKNIPQLIKSLKFLPEEIELVCVGKNFYPHPIPEWQWIETQIAMSDVAARVHFLNEIKGEAAVELSAIYSGAAVYVQPSLYEGFGLPVIEAMQCQVPVVSTKNSSLIEVGSSTEKNYVEFVETDAESIAAGIQKVLELSISQRENMISQASQWAQQFSWQKVAQETVAVYKKVLEI